MGWWAWALEVGAHWWALALAALGSVGGLVVLLKPAAILAALRRWQEMRRQAAIERREERIDDREVKLERAHNDFIRHVMDEIGRQNGEISRLRDAHAECERKHEAAVRAFAQQRQARDEELAGLRSEIRLIRRACPNCPDPAG